MDPDKACDGPMENCCSRPNAVSMLRNKARSLRDKAHGLEKLADKLDCCRMDQEMDEALWELVNGCR